MPSPADSTAVEHRAGRAGARLALVSTPGALAIATGVLALMMSVDLNPADQRYPQVLAVILALVGVWNLIADLRERGTDEEMDPEYGRLVAWRVVAFIALISLSIWLVTPIGFYPAAGLLTFGGLWIMGVRKPLVLIAYPLILIGAGYLLFSVLIGVPLPLARGF